jgi:ribosomal protein L37E
MTQHCLYCHKVLFLDARGNCAECGYPEITKRLDYWFLASLKGLTWLAIGSPERAAGFVTGMAALIGILIAYLLREFT